MEAKSSQKKIKCKNPQEPNSIVQNVYVKHPVPHSKKQELIMNGLVIPGLREIWVACGNKFGKTLAGATALSKLNLRRSPIKTRWIAPIYRQSLIGMDYFVNLLPPKPHAEFKKSQMVIEMPYANNKIEFWHGQDPYALEGPAIDGDVLDECAKMKEEVYNSERTTKIRTKGPSIYISTPLGKNWFFTRCMEAKEHQEWAIKNGKQPQKIFITARTLDNQHIDPDVVEQARKELPTRLFEQHYEAKFIDDGTVFTNINVCIYTEKLDLDPKKQRWFHAEASTKSVVIGADWAKQGDWTVFIAIDMQSKLIIGLERFHQIPYTEQVRRLRLFANHFKDVQIVFHDKTGVGNAIDDLLVYTNLAYHGITFSNPIKAGMVAKLITSLEQEFIHYPHWPELIKELTIFELKTSMTGLPVYGAPSGKHDDIVMSLLLANMALLEYADRSYEINYLEELKSENEIESYYNELLEDD